ncbi:hypothetical protein, partial [Streptomyces mirabilis]|uniref:hypothetical protein n=1 Tax=Streptomyces mirabilis TaxID=68239 RepID=UPI00365AB493
RLELGGDVVVLGERLGGVAVSGRLRRGVVLDVDRDGVGGGGGDGGGSDSSSSEDSSRDKDAQSLRQEHKGEDGEPQLTLDNAYRALDGAPEGTRARVMPKENELQSKPNAKKSEKVHNPDLEYLDQQGDIVGYGEVKTIGEANETTFSKRLNEAVQYLRWRQDWAGGTEVNEIFIQVPDLAEASEVKGWVRRYQNARRGGVKSIRGFRLRVYSESGTDLGSYDLGTDSSGIPPGGFNSWGGA